jgi:hypothetical protein
MLYISLFFECLFYGNTTPCYKGLSAIREIMSNLAMDWEIQSKGTLTTRKKIDDFVLDVSLIKMGSRYA